MVRTLGSRPSDPGSSPGGGIIADLRKERLSRDLPSASPRSQISSSFFQKTQSSHRVGNGSVRLVGSRSWASGGVSCGLLVTSGFHDASPEQHSPNLWPGWFLSGPQNG